MKQSGEHRIGAPADAVWLALNDPDVLSLCIDGCQSLTRSGDDAFAATVRRRIGELNAVFIADVKLADVDPPNAYTLEASVRGGAAGFAHGVARVSLIEEGRETLLRYDVEGTVGGKLAEVGPRLIDADARRMADDFFARFGDVVTHAGSAPAARAPARPNLLAPALVAAAAIAALFAVLWWRRPAAPTQTQKTA
ncbi:MAG TPA: carbon monoxide dehydrogenase subunit G [Caulobacteraceae bacterium]|nr:carbon monoxide dehydrogenase subunit G [Caulobacteraceae bacterium]